MRRLRRAGFGRDFVSQAIIPDWWDPSCADQPDLLPDIEIRVARFLALSLAAVRDPDTPLATPQFANAQLRRVRDIDRERLGPSIHAGLRIAEAVTRNLRPGSGFRAVPSDAMRWRGQLRSGDEPIGLNHLLTDLWHRGIPVIPLEALPSPTFQGMACTVQDLGERSIPISQQPRLGVHYKSPQR